MKQLIPDKYWNNQIEVSNILYKEWDNLFKCERLEEYYEGRQWPQMRQLNYDPYTINKVFETIQIKIAQFVPTFLRFEVSAKPSHAEYDIETAITSAQTKQDTINTLIDNPKIHFPEELEGAYKDSFFRFGLIEVGYAADWVTNPNAPKPLLKSTTEESPSRKQKQQVKLEPKELPMNERIFFKHIRARRFRVGGHDSRYLDQSTWCGYYEFIDKDQLLAITNLLNKDKFNDDNSKPSDMSILEYSDKETRQRGSKTVKVWHVWHNEAKLRLLLLDSPRLTLFQRRFDRLPLFDYRPDKRLLTDGFYPIPQVFHWLSCQNEINETREMLRAHRRRFVRKYQVVEGTMDVEEIEKFETGPDGAIVVVKRAEALTPIQNASLDSSENLSIQTSADDLNKISATASELRGVADRTTATQANIINQRSGIRENKERDRFTLWLSYVGREGLLVARDKFTLGIWAKISSPEGENFLNDVQENLPVYKWISSEDLSDGYDFNIDVDVTTLSVAIQEEEKKKFVEFLSLMTQFPAIAFSPTMVREAAYRTGYRNNKVIKEMQKMALLMEMGRMQQLQGQVQMPNNGNAPQQITSQMTPPTADQARTQIQNQLVQQ